MATTGAAGSGAAASVTLLLAAGLFGAGTERSCSSAASTAARISSRNVALAGVARTLEVSPADCAVTTTASASQSIVTMARRSDVISVRKMDNHRATSRASGAWHSVAARPLRDADSASPPWTVNEPGEAVPAERASAVRDRASSHAVARGRRGLGLGRFGSDRRRAGLSKARVLRWTQRAHDLGLRGLLPRPFAPPALVPSLERPFSSAATSGLSTSMTIQSKISRRSARSPTWRSCRSRERR